MISAIPKWILIVQSFLIVTHTSLFSQCATYIQMTDIGVEGCSLPVVVATQQILTPCTSPPGFWDLEVGEFAYVDFTLSACPNICQVGGEVDITCIDRISDIKNETQFSKIKLYPTVAESTLFIEGPDLRQAILYDVQGRVVISKSLSKSDHVDISGLPISIYYIHVITDSSVKCFTFMKI